MKGYNRMNTLLFLNNIGTTEVIIIAVLILLLFGGKKIPEGKGVKSFKEGMKDVEKDIDGKSESDKK